MLRYLQKAGDRVNIVTTDDQKVRRKEGKMPHVGIFSSISSVKNTKKLRGGPLAKWAWIGERCKSCFVMLSSYE